MIRVRWIAISFVMRQRCFPHIGMFPFLHRECINLHEGRLRKKNAFTLHFEMKVKIECNLAFCSWLSWRIAAFPSSTVVYYVSLLQ